MSHETGMPDMGEAILRSGVPPHIGQSPVPGSDANINQREPIEQNVRSNAPLKKRGWGLGVRGWRPGNGGRGRGARGRGGGGGGRGAGGRVSCGATCRGKRLPEQIRMTARLVRCESGASLV